MLQGGPSGAKILAAEGILLFSETLRPAVGPTQLYNQRVGGSFPGGQSCQDMVKLTLMSVDSQI
jgi:hypothetical protein